MLPFDCLGWDTICPVAAFCFILFILFYLALILEVLACLLCLRPILLAGLALLFLFYDQVLGDRSPMWCIVCKVHSRVCARRPAEALPKFAVVLSVLVLCPIFAGWGGTPLFYYTHAGRVERLNSHQCQPTQQTFSQYGWCPLLRFFERLTPLVNTTLWWRAKKLKCWRWMLLRRLVLLCILD